MLKDSPYVLHEQQHSREWEWGLPLLRRRPRAVGLWCLTLIIGRFSRDHREF